MPASLLKLAVETKYMTGKILGTVKWFDDKKGYGFIVNPDGQDAFVHYRSIQQEDYKTLREGQDIEYTHISSDKEWQAAEVAVVSDRKLSHSLRDSHSNQPQF